jgi:hypothetical protein
MLNRLKQALEARRLARQQVKLIQEGKKWGKTAGEVIEMNPFVMQLDRATFRPDQAAARCGYVYGFSDVCCQHVGLERGGLASRNAAVTALNIVVSDRKKAAQMIELFLVKDEQRAEFDRGMRLGAAGANGFLNKGRWSDGITGIAQALIKQT